MSARVASARAPRACMHASALPHAAVPLCCLLRTRRLVLLQPNWKQQELPPTFGPMHVVMAYNELLAEGLGAR